MPQLQHRLSRVLVDLQQSCHRTSSARRQRPTAILLITSVTFWIRSISRHLRGYSSTLRVLSHVLDMSSCMECMNNTIFDCSILFALIFTDFWHPHFEGAISWSDLENAMVCTVAEPWLQSSSIIQAQLIQMNNFWTGKSHATLDIQSETEWKTKSSDCGSLSTRFRILDRLFMFVLSNLEGEVLCTKAGLLRMAIRETKATTMTPLTSGSARTKHDETRGTRTISPRT